VDKEAEERQKMSETKSSEFQACEARFHIALVREEEVNITNNVW
jgi:hypothetical protein